MGNARFPWGRAARRLAAMAATCASLAWAGTVTPGLTPIGGVVELAGIARPDFAPKRAPKVQLDPAPGFPIPGVTSVRAKVVDFDADSVRVQVLKGLAGVYTVQITPAEGTTPFAVGALLLIGLPTPAAAEPAAGPAKSAIAIRGNLFGSIKGTVTIGGRKAKVTSWSNDLVGVVVPRKLAPGVHPVVVTNRAGASNVPLVFTVTAPPSPGDEFFRADIAAHGHFEVDVRHATRFTATHTLSTDTLAIAGTESRRSGVPVLAVSMSPFEPQRLTPYTVDRFPLEPSTTIAVSTYAQAGPLLHMASAANDGSALTLTITSWDGTYLEGRFEGTLVDAAGGGTGPIAITNGEFRVRPTEAP